VDFLEITIESESIYVPSDDVVCREIEGELIIVPITSGIGNLEDRLFTLNESGKVIWQQLDGKQTVAAIATNIISCTGGSPEQITRDVMGFIQELVRRKLVLCKK